MDTWQRLLRQCVTSLEQLARHLDINPLCLKEVTARYPMRIPPYYLSLIREAGDPIWRQAVPDPRELVVDSACMADPLEEESQSPVANLVHRYPDRVLMLVCSECAMYCRFCTRKRKVGGEQMTVTRETVKQGLAYIRSRPEVREVILSGGDPLLLPDAQLEWVLRELRATPTVEVIRIGSRVPVVLPQRITTALTRMLRRFQPLYLNTHFNHPDEITDLSSRACARLADAGIPLGNQSVLMRGVNDDPEVMRRLVLRLLAIRVRPYYLYQADMVQGTDHFRTTVEEGIEIIRALRGYSSGMAIPTYVIDAPGGGGKIPLLPDYLQQLGPEVLLENYCGDPCTYLNPGAPFAGQGSAAAPMAG